MDNTSEPKTDKEMIPHYEAMIESSIFSCAFDLAQVNKPLLRQIFNQIKNTYFGDKK